MAQIILGAIQVLMSITIMIHFAEQSKIVKKLFIIYIMTTVSIIILFRIIGQYVDGGFGFVFLWIIVTMLLAIFHLYITYKIQKS